MSRNLMKKWLLKDLLMYANDPLVCPCCGLVQPRADNFELDHVEPKSDYGRDTVGNRILLCGPCNREKSNGKTIAALHKHNVANGVTMKEDMEFLRGLLKNLCDKANERKEEFLLDMDRKETPLLSQKA